VLDNQNAQFRVRGLVTAVLTADDITTITVMNIDINVDEETDIIRRASGRGNDIPPSELAIGDIVNVSGGLKNDFLHAVRVHVGNRLEGEIELEGEISAVNEGDIVVLIDGAIPIMVVIGENTSVSGDLIVGAYVEVEGQFNEFLAVLGFEIVVDEDGDADDDNNRGRRGDHNPNDDNTKIASKIKLQSDSDDITATASFRYIERNTKIKQKVEIEIEEGSAHSNYTIIVVFGVTEANFGLLTTDDSGDSGDGEVEFENDDDGSDNLTSLIPIDMDVTDITSIKILEGDNIVLEGSF